MEVHRRIALLPLGSDNIGICIISEVIVRSNRGPHCVSPSVHTGLRFLTQITKRLYEIYNNKQDQQYVH